MPKPDPVGLKLERIENLLESLPQPLVMTEKVEGYNDRNLMARLDFLETRLEKLAGAVVALQKRTFDFQIERDSKNFITSIKVTRPA